VLAGQRDAAVDLAQVVVVRGTRIVIPDPEAAHRERRAMPCHGDAVVEFARYCGWIWLPYSTAFPTRSAGVIAVNSMA
jgi:hypothetical protein